MKIKIFFYITLIITSLLWISCKEKEDPLFTLEQVSINLGSTPQDVFFIFTNPSLTDTTEVAPSLSASTRNANADSKNLSYEPVVKDQDIFDRINNFEKEVYSTLNKNSRNLNSPNFAFTPVDDSENDIKEFYLNKTIPDPIDYGVNFIEGVDYVNATCRSVTTYDGMTLSIWVDDRCWTGAGIKVNEINEVSDNMVSSLADSFLNAAVGNDINSWVTDIYGVPWGIVADYYTGLIPSTESGKLTILLLDIGNDNSSNGGTVGYFWSKDNFLATEYSGSNERIMFYIDAVMYAEEESGSWDLTDFWPEVIYSTLAHEYQHMIQFYQKQLTFNTYETEVWLNEMCSELTEDFISDKLDVPGPRGLGIDYSVGTQGITNSRLNEFNLYNDESLVEWGGFTSDYSSVYAFGAFLARNYGGAALFRNIVQRAETDEFAIVNAVNTINGSNKTFEDLLIEWGRSVLTSDSPGSTGYNFISPEIQSSADDPSGSDYSLGSINLENYGIDVGWTLWGPKIYNGSISNDMPVLEPISNTYYQAGNNLTGPQSWSVEVPAGVTLTVVQKDS